MKKIVSLLMSLVLFVSLTVPAFADFVNDSMQDETVVVSSDTGGTRLEETEWYYRIADGLFQKRLWSLTYGYWLTDWITIGYV